MRHRHDGRKGSSTRPGLLETILPAAITPTVYARVGDMPAALLVTLGIMLVIRRRRRGSSTS
jgi:apolipoprotein N-acyltransferase